jgi:hypothetical protein
MPLRCSPLIKRVRLIEAFVVGNRDRIAKQLRVVISLRRWLGRLDLISGCEKYSSCLQLASRDGSWISVGLDLSARFYRGRRLPVRSNLENQAKEQNAVSESNGVPKDALYEVWK